MTSRSPPQTTKKLENSIQQSPSTSIPQSSSAPLVYNGQNSSREPSFIPSTIKPTPATTNKLTKEDEDLLFMDSDEASAASLARAAHQPPPSTSTLLSPLPLPQPQPGKKQSPLRSSAAADSSKEKPLSPSRGVMPSSSSTSPLATTTSPRPTYSGKQLPIVLQVASVQHPRKKQRKKRAAAAAVVSYNPENGSRAASRHSDEEGDENEQEQEFDTLDGFLSLQDQLLKLGLGHQDKDAPSAADGDLSSQQQQKQDPSQEQSSSTPPPPAFAYPPASEEDFDREKQKCLEILDLVMQNECSHYFLFPVDSEALGLPDYHVVVKKPQDLTSVKTRLEELTFGSLFITPSPSSTSLSAQQQIPLRSPLDVLIDGIGQTLQNCYLYNPKGTPIRKDAWFLIAYFDHLLHTHNTGRRVNWRLYWGIDDFRSHDKIVNDKRRGPKTRGRYAPRRDSISQRAVAAGGGAKAVPGGSAVGKRKRGSGIHRNPSNSSMPDALLDPHALSIGDYYEDGVVRKRRLNVGVFSRAVAGATLLHSILAASATSATTTHSHALSSSSI